MLSNSKIYVAGHRGMVGSAIVRELQRQGYTHIITRTHAELDLTRQDAVERFFAEEKPEYVFLAAAKVGGIVANQSALADFMYDNMILEMNVIHAAWKNGCKKLEFLGSSCIYPRMAPQPMPESCLLTSELEKTNEAYALAKISGLKYCEFLNRQYGTDYISVMPTNLYGPNDNFHLENSHVLPAMIRKIHLAKCLNEGDWEAVRKDIGLRPVTMKVKATGEVKRVDASSSEADILEVLAYYGITPEAVTLWGTGSPLREFLWSEEMADASVHVLLNVDFKDTYKENYNADHINEIRNCHINVGTGKEISIKAVAELIMKEIGFKGELRWDATKPDGTLKKLTDPTKLHELGWHHKIEIDEGVHRLYQWYLQGICINHQAE